MRGLTRLACAFLLALTAATPVYGRGLPIEGRTLAELRALSLLDGRVVIEALALEDGSFVSLELERFEVFAPDAVVLNHSEAGEEVVPLPTDRYFRGTVKGDDSSQVFLAVGRTVRGHIQTRDGVHVVVSREIPTRVGAGSNEVQVVRIDLDRDAPAAARGWRCSAGEESQPGTPTEVETREGLPHDSLTSTMYGAGINIETDYELYAQVGSAESLATYVADLVGAASVVYQRDVQVSLSIASLHTYSSPAQCPWKATASTNAALEELKAYYVAHPERWAGGVLAHLLSGKDLGGGLAWVGGLCQSAWAYGVSASLWGFGPYDRAVPKDADGYPTTYWDLLVFTHEVGHSFGSRHTHCYSPPIDTCCPCEPGSAADCYGTPPPEKATIMSYCHQRPGGLGNILMYLGRAGQASQAVTNTIRTLVEARASCLQVPEVTVLRIVPNSGPNSGGTAITVTGTGFVPGLQMGFSADDWSESSLADVVVVNSTTATARTLPTTYSGPASLWITVPWAPRDARWLRKGYTYLAPRITSVAPASGSACGGTRITVHGEGFVPGMSVWLVGPNRLTYAARDVVVVDGATLTALTGDAQSWPILCDLWVGYPGGYAGTPLRQSFSYLTARPTVTKIVPVWGPDTGGTRITLTGTSFRPAASVSVCGTKATNVLVVDETTITATTAAREAGLCDVVVSLPDGCTGTLNAGFSLRSSRASGMWMWIGGSKWANSIGTYGLKGVAAPGNFPGARSGAVSWTDNRGDFWLFGGSGYGSAPTENIGYLNDLWKYDIGSGLWTWMSGSSGVDGAGSYGTKGVAAPDNVPEARVAAGSFADGQGGLWLFGGRPKSGGYKNDLWRYEVGSGLWTWVSGSSGSDEFGTYGTVGVSAAGNVPGARIAATSQNDAEGTLWLFGGLGQGANQFGWLGDVWSYDTGSGQWTWRSGSSTPYARGIYGTMGVGAPGNAPGARVSANSWTSPGGILWLFGGQGLPRVGGGSIARLNDLWQFSSGERIWAWVRGSDVTMQYGIYGTQGVEDEQNTPGARTSAVTWSDANGDLWLFGGSGLGATGAEGVLRDLWRFDVMNGNWAWVGGSTGTGESGSYGARGIATAQDFPGARGSSASWTDGKGNLWLFGGGGVDSNGKEGVLNDLWVFGASPCTPPPVPAPTTDGPVCEGGTLRLTTSEVTGATYSWKGPSGFSSSVRSPTIANATTAMTGAYGVTVTVDGCVSAEGQTYATVNAVPPAPGASSNSPVKTGETIVLTAAGLPGSGFSWSGPNGFTSSLRSPMIANAEARHAGTYYVTATVSGCRSQAGSTTIIVIGSPLLSVARLGSGAGTISSSPAGISCGSVCSSVYLPGTVVSLRAAPADGSRFAGWAGGSCAGTGTCSVKMNAAETVSATFLPAGAVRYYSISPCRIVDTRAAAGPLSGPGLVAGATREFRLGGACGVPPEAAAVSLNATVADATEEGSLTIYPGSGPSPGTNTISFRPGKNRANNVTTGLIGGVLSVVNSQVAGTLNLIVDVNGYYE